MTLCGSTKFRSEFERLNKEFSLQGWCVFTCVWGDPEDGFPPEDEKTKFDEVHLRKIKLSEMVYIINVGGYIGESTSREISYAISQGKELRWLEPPDMAVIERARETHKGVAPPEEKGRILPDTELVIQLAPKGEDTEFEKDAVDVIETIKGLLQNFSKRLPITYELILRFRKGRE